MADHLRRSRLLQRYKVVQRNHLSRVGLHVVAVDILRPVAELSFGLHVHSVRAIVKVKIVHVNRSHVHLQSVRDLIQRNVQALRLLPVDLHQILRIVRCECREQSRQDAALIARSRKLIRRVG